ncbi:hypothetical protein QJS10_CPA03g02160 [Acorus calamus]|uniref:Small auxin up regulated protein n=1 Tax=Acorus calamus TaxID=4465 RepID=A0AAV9F9G8_ACOCL|nr:hypothetical protein QJS10_CPA03g02160 [Acorus calamus]
MLRRWRTRATTRRQPDVPAGHVAVRVGSESRRFVVKLAHLNHPGFRSLLVRAEEEFGFDHVGPIYIPCDESAFEDFLGSLEKTRIQQRRRPIRDLDLWAESRPLLAAAGLVL